jgi:hypothetical protein
MLVVHERSVTQVPEWSGHPAAAGSAAAPDNRIGEDSTLKTALSHEVGRSHLVPNGRDGRASVVLDDVRPVRQAIIDIDVVDHFLVYIAVTRILELETKVALSATSAAHVRGPACMASATGLNGDIMKAHLAPRSTIYPSLTIVAEDSDGMRAAIGELKSHRTFGIRLGSCK